MGKYRDFDRFFEESKKEPIIIRLFNKEYSIEAELPATLVLLQMRAMATGEDITKEQQMKIAIDLIGENVIQEWADKGLSADQLTDIMTWVLEQITSAESDADEGTKSTQEASGKKSQS